MFIEDNQQSKVELLTEVEMIINSWPLTYLSLDDVKAPLTPAHFLMGRQTLSFPDSLNYECEDDDDDLTVIHKQLNSGVSMWFLTSSGNDDKRSTSCNYK